MPSDRSCDRVTGNMTQGASHLITRIFFYEYVSLPPRYPSSYALPRSILPRRLAGSTGWGYLGELRPGCKERSGSGPGTRPAALR